MNEKELERLKRNANSNLVYTVNPLPHSLLNYVFDFGNLEPADDEVKELVKSVKSAVEGKANAKYNEFEAVSFTTQVVAGTNFLVKVKVDNDEYIHVKIFRPLPCNGTELEVLDVKTGKTLNDNLLK